MTDKEQGQNPLKLALKECTSVIPSLATFGLAINLLMLTIPIFMMQVFDRVLGSQVLETLFFLTLIAGFALFIMGVLEVMRGRLLSRVGRWLERRLSGDMISLSMRSTLSGHNLGFQPLQDLNTVRSFISSNTVNALLDAPWMPIYIGVLWILHPAIGMVGLFAAILLFGIALLNEYIARGPLQEASKISIPNQKRIQSAVREAAVMHAMGMLPAFMSRWQAEHRKTQDLQMVALDRSALLFGLTKFARSFIQVLILGTGAYYVLQGELTAGGMIAGSILLGRALAPVEQSIGAWKGFVSARGAYQRLDEVTQKFPHPAPTTPLPAPKGQLACESVAFMPQGHKEPILRGITFDVSNGQGLGIIGPSAAGKSTLCKILVGIQKPTAGHARIDGADIFAWPCEQLGPYMGYLPQSVELFAGTITTNIARLNPDPDPAEVVEAAKMAGVHDMILRLPNGYDTEIGEDGAMLSGGQRQRIGLARAFYGKPRLIILDEPNANLDAEGEMALLQAIERAKGWGATVVLVAHQTHMMKAMDKLLVLANGQVRAFGDRDEVFSSLQSAPSSSNALANQRRTPPREALIAANGGPSE